MKLTTAILAAALLATPAFAGGPVIADDPEVAAPVRNNALPLILLGLAVVAVVLGNGPDACNGPDDTPTDGGC